MRRALARLAAATAWALLAALSLAGLGLSALSAYAALFPSGPAVSALVARGAGRLIAGRLTIEGVAALARGGLELRGLALHDPDGHLVLAAARARVFVNLTRLTERRVGLVVELESPSIVLATEPDGGLSLARAFASPRAGPAAIPRREALSIDLTRLTARGGDLRWLSSDGSTALLISHLDLDARGSYSEPRAELDLRLGGEIDEPAAGPLAVALVASLDGDRLQLDFMNATLGGTSFEGLGEMNVASLAFRAAVRRLGIASADARLILPAETALAGDVTGVAYGESDGATLTAALEVEPSGGAAPPETARAAVAHRFGPARPALGFDVALAAFDPSLLFPRAPKGRLDLTTHGAAAGRTLRDLRGRLTLALAPSRLKGIDLGPVALEARAGEGFVEVGRLDAKLTGLSVTGHGTWRERGEVGGDFAVDASDLARAGRALSELLGVSLPPLEGRGHARATLGGSAKAPVLTASIDAPILGVGSVRAESATLSLEAKGPLASASLAASGRAARANLYGVEARELSAGAALQGEEASFSVKGAVPAVGRDPVGLEGKARLGANRRGAEVYALTVRWPGSSFALARSAKVTFAPPTVDRLELASGERTVAISGGAGPKETLDLRLELVRFDLGALPRGLLPEKLGLEGEVTLDARATGPSRSPAVTARGSVAQGAAFGIGGLSGSGDLSWDERGRLAATARLARAEGGALSLAAHLPLPLARAPSGEKTEATVIASSWPLEPLRRAAGLGAPVAGAISFRAELSGTAGAPRLKASLALDDGAYADLRPIAISADLDDQGGSLKVKASARLAEAPLLALEASAPLELAPLVKRPGAALQALSHAPLAGKVEVPGLALARVAGKLGLPADLAGTLSAEGSLSGQPIAPRGRATVRIEGGAVAGYRDIAAQVTFALEAARTSATARASLAGAEALEAEGSFGAPVERLIDGALLRSAPLVLELTVPEISLSRAAGPALPIEGRLFARLSARGTLSRPAGRLELEGKAIRISDRPVGDLTVAIHHEAPTSRAELSLSSPAGGLLKAAATMEAPGGLAEPGAFGNATATLKVTSDGLDLGFLPGLLPGTVRYASGRLTVDLAASGRVRDLRPQGSVQLERGRLDLAAIGDFSEIELAATLGADAVEVTRLEARRGKGHLSGKLSAHDLASGRARLSGHLALKEFMVSYAGIDYATLDLPVELEGSLTRSLLDLTATIPSGTVHLPGKSSGGLQPVAARSDIVEADLVPERPRRWPWTAAPVAAGAERPPFEIRVRVVVSGKILVKGENPPVNVDLKGDTTWRIAEGKTLASGTVDVVRGTVEPINGRLFLLERARVSFPGGPLAEGTLDVEARYDNPIAVITVNVEGTVAKPALRFSSQPQMDDATIALIIATGRSEVNLNTSNVSPLTAQEASAAIVGAAVSSVFSGLVQNRLPVDQISLDTTRLYAGKYVTDQLFVGYVYRFEAKPDQGENVNEVRAEYRLARRWRFELRYGDANVGDASIIWSTDY